MVLYVIAYIYIDTKCMDLPVVSVSASPPFQSIAQLDVLGIHDTSHMYLRISVWARLFMRHFTTAL